MRSIPAIRRSCCRPRLRWTPARRPLDALLITTDAITGCVQEGIGDQGIHLIDFIEDADDEIHVELRRVRSAAQTSAAWMLMVEGVPPRRRRLSARYRHGPGSLGAGPAAHGRAPVPRAVHLVLLGGQ